MVVIDRGTSLERLVVERFDYWLERDAWGDRAVLELLANLGADPAAPAAAHLVARPDAGGLDLVYAAAHACGLERRLLTTGPAGFEYLWSARFALPLEVVEAPSALFQLIAGDGLAVALGLPRPAWRDADFDILAVSQTRLGHQRTMRERTVGSARQLVALATSVAVTATSVPAAALAAAHSGRSVGASFTAGTPRRRAAKHPAPPQTQTQTQTASVVTAPATTVTAAAPPTTTVATAPPTTTAAAAPPATTTSTAPVTVTTTTTTTTTTTAAPSAATPATAPAPAVTRHARTHAQRAKHHLGAALSFGPGAAATPVLHRHHPAHPTTPAAPLHKAAPHPAGQPHHQPATHHRPKPTPHHHTPPAPFVPPATLPAPIPVTPSPQSVTVLSNAPTGFSGPKSWTGTVAADPSLTGAVTELRGLLSNGDRPPSFLIPIYMEAGHRYHVPWQVLAAINAIETDYGTNLNTSSAGAVGWMQFEPSTWAQYGVAVDGHTVPNPYDPRDAIFSAARYLAAAGAGQDVSKAVFAYNHASWYVDEVMSRARAIATHVQYERETVRHGVFTIDFAGTEKAARRVRYTSGVLSHFDRLIAAANMVSAANFPYVWGGGHTQPARFAPFDCSGSVSYVMQQAGYKLPTTVSGDIPSWKLPAGPGRVTIFYNPTHTFMRIGDRYFGTSGFARPGGGAGWFDVDKLPADYLAQFKEAHVPGLGADSFSASDPAPFVTPFANGRHHRTKPAKVRWWPVLSSLGAFPSAG